MTLEGTRYQLVLDLQGMQSQFGDRGIARNVREQAKALLRRNAVAALMLNPDQPFPRTLDQDLLSSPLLHWNTQTNLRAVAEAAGGPLAYYVISPFELTGHAESELPTHALLGDIPLVATLHDLIPLVLSDRYLHDAAEARRYRAHMEFLHQCDLVLSVSAHTARDAVEHLELAPERVRVIGGGVSPYFHRAGAGESPEVVLQRNLPAIVRPFVLTVAGGDPRKNVEGLVEAWAGLPGGVRVEHQLVLACSLDRATRASWLAHAESLGVGPDELVFTAWISDEVLRALYQQARAFVFASLYEGFGLPAAEAIACGCPTITSNTSSLPEVLEWPASTFDPSDAGSIAAVVERALTDESYRRELTARGADRLPELSWGSVAERMLAALAELPEPSHAHTALPVRIALVGPMPPMASGIADYNAGLVPHLVQRCQLDVFTPAARPPQPLVPGVRWFPPAALSRNVSPWSYDLVVYTVGNSDDHHDLFEQAEEFPGLLWMHDVRLPGLYLTYARERMTGDGKRNFLAERLLRQYRRRLPATLDIDADALPTDYSADGIGMSRELVAIHRGVVVSSELALRLLTLDQQPDAPVPRTWVLPLAVPETLSGGAVSGSVTVVSFGIVAPVKAPALVIEAFAAALALAASDGEARLVFVGLVGDALRRDLEEVARTCGIEERVHFTGYCSRADYEGWLREATGAVQLRLATNGESSAAVHECIANGIPVITNAASASELPDDVVRLVPYDVDVPGLASQLHTVLTDPGAVARQQAAQRAYAGSWGFAQVADRLLEIVAEVTRTGRS